MRFVRSSSAVFRVIRGETVIVAPSEAKAIVLNGTASWLWHALERPMLLDEFADAMAAHFKIDRAIALRDASAFIESLEARGLVER
jgi:hypothetical protein